MDAAALRAAQAPLKETYRSDSATARIPTAARGDYRDPDVSATIDGFAGPVRAGLHRATGGDGTDACSADLLLEAVLACAAVTLRAVATSMGVEIRSAHLAADGWWDARGTLGVDRQAPVGVRDIVVTLTLDTDADDATLGKLAVATERYCVVGQTLAEPPTIRVERA
ncbi:MULTISPECIES: OsmC family protein [unclassified Nocardioides]|uniref:OsmC family protein n=1 Tax=unclassified Nocardioides TaxID=2615069 RepID=UPI0006FE0212|nr:MULTISPECIES: OsmC family protein [unclassified Nocardioides]KRA37984.1 osmotically inducible protein OsmC [Nocardioides sp. Root614]KRA91944.1 osmotically inducible protein OsmC [Nocardioides sp. Root682]